ncbi:MAG: hypothetical protein LBG60_12320 [Bifidobacteriaceae bacterium]|jgi:hypothetical protein|nr:hypothetical protein [Bifidobacteriaceae bacterium]
MRYYGLVVDLLIRDMPLELKLDIARAAKANGTSQSAEAIARLRRGSDPMPRPVKLRLHHGSAETETTWGRDEIYGDDAR